MQRSCLPISLKDPSPPCHPDHPPDLLLSPGTTGDSRGRPLEGEPPPHNIEQPEPIRCPIEEPTKPRRVTSHPVRYPDPECWLIEYSNTDYLIGGHQIPYSYSPHNSKPTPQQPVPIYRHPVLPSGNQALYAAEQYINGSPSSSTNDNPLLHVCSSALQSAANTRSTNAMKMMNNELEMLKLLLKGIEGTPVQHDLLEEGFQSMGILDTP